MDVRHLRALALSGDHPRKMPGVEEANGVRHAGNHHDDVMGEGVPVCIDIPQSIENPIEEVVAFLGQDLLCDVAQGRRAVGATQDVQHFAGGYVVGFHQRDEQTVSCGVHPSPGVEVLRHQEQDCGLDPDPAGVEANRLVSRDLARRIGAHCVRACEPFASEKANQPCLSLAERARAGLGHGAGVHEPWPAAAAAAAASPEVDPCCPSAPPRRARREGGVRRGVPTPKDSDDLRGPHQRGRRCARRVRRLRHPIRASVRWRRCALRQRRPPSRALAPCGAHAVLVVVARAVPAMAQPTPLGLLMPRTRAAAQGGEGGFSMTSDARRPINPVRGTALGSAIDKRAQQIAASQKPVTRARRALRWLAASIGLAPCALAWVAGVLAEALAYGWRRGRGSNRK